MLSTSMSAPYFPTTNEFAPLSESHKNKSSATEKQASTDLSKPRKANRKRTVQTRQRDLNLQSNTGSRPLPLALGIRTHTKAKAKPSHVQESPLRCVSTDESGSSVVATLLPGHEIVRQIRFKSMLRASNDESIQPIANQNEVEDRIEKKIGSLVTGRTSTPARSTVLRGDLSIESLSITSVSPRVEPDSNILDLV